MSTFCVFCCAESDPAVIYSAVRTEDISYGRIIIKDKKTRPQMRGTAALLCLLTVVMWVCLSDSILNNLQVVQDKFTEWRNSRITDVDT